MIFDSLGFPEILVVIVLTIFLVDPKKLGKILRELGKYRRKLSQFQREVKTQIDSLTAAVDAAEAQGKLTEDKAGMRKWAKEQVQALPAAARAAAADALVKSLAEWPSYGRAKVVSCFAGGLDEIDTAPLLARIL